MAFVNENISPDDYEKYGLGAIDGQYLATSSGSSSWTFDRERDIYLRHTQSFRDWRNGIVGWNFYWRGHLFEFESQVLKSRGKRNGPIWQHRKLFGFVVPPPLAAHRQAIEDDLRESFLASREASTRSTSTSFSLQLDITDEEAPQ
jgi:hypothetical protein